MNRPGPLEDSYRRLLALYPATHRIAHEEEMLGVLLAGAGAGQRRPRLAESANLIWGALLIRLHPRRGGSADRWRDALAVVSVVLPLLILVHLAVSDTLFLAAQIPGKVFLAAVLPYLAAWIILAAVVLLRLRRTAALAAAGMLIWSVASIADVPNWGYIGPESMFNFLALGLEITALVASPGPRRGRQLLTWKHYALTVAVAATATTVINMLWQNHPAVSDAIVITVLAASAAAMVAASPLSRRIMVLLSVPAYYYIVGLVVMPSMVGGPYEYTSGWTGPLRITLACLPVAAIACVAVTAAFRSGHSAISR